VWLQLFEPTSMTLLTNSCHLFTLQQSNNLDLRQRRYNKLKSIAYKYQLKTTEESIA
jgi:hypothetical protein